MHDTQLPSNYARVPPAVGTKGQGNLGADEWRTFCTINLPVTLVALWGPLGEGSREHQLLCNFMHLVTAVKLASSRRTTSQRLEDYRTHMHRYLVELLELFPGTSILHNQHKALHIPDVFSRIGPAHVQWCFGQERGNGDLEDYNTNNRICE